MGAPTWHCVFVTINLFMVTHLCQNVYMHQYMYLCSSDSPFQFDALWIVTWKDVCPCVAAFLCPIHLIVLPQLVWNVYMHQYMYLCEPEFWILLHLLCIVTWKHGCQCVALCMLQSSHFCSRDLFKMCTCISTCIYANLSSQLCCITYA